jgi:hypothetical protein
MGKRANQRRHSGGGRYGLIFQRISYPTTTGPAT